MHNEHNCHRSNLAWSFHKVGGTIYPRYHLPINSSNLKILSLPQRETVLIQSMLMIILFLTIDILLRRTFLNASLCYPPFLHTQRD